MTQITQIYGIRTVMEAIKSGETIDKIFIQQGLSGSLVRELEELIKAQNIHISYVPVEKLNRLNKKNHQGVIATVSPVKFMELETLVSKATSENRKALFLLLDQISDVRNLGAIIRTAECAGVDGIILPAQGSAPINADTVKTSAGAIFNIPLVKVSHLKDAVYYLHGSGVQVVGATEKTNQSLYDIDFNSPTALIMGSEDKGISPSLLKIVDQKAKIPLLGSTDSLNVSVACGISLYEIVRQRKLS